DLEMESRPYGRAGVADPSDDLAGGDFLPDRDQNLGGMGVKRVKAPTVIQYSTLAVAIEPAHVVHPGLGNRRDGSAEGSGDVDAAVVGSRVEAGIFPVPEGAHDLPGHGPGQPALVLREIPEKRQHPARAALRAGQTALLQLPDQGL